MEKVLLPCLDLGDVVVMDNLKHLLRRSGPRSAALWKAIGTHLHTFTPLECPNYFRNSAYAPA